MKDVLCLIAVAFLIIGAVALGNCDAEERCESLRLQGVKVYVSTGVFSKKCEVIQRDLVSP